MRATALAFLLRPAVALAAEDPAPIQDNSFLVEEAYNQERGVVQHISTYARSEGGDEWVYSFTQEWPLGRQEHQIGFTVPVVGTEDGTRRNRGLSDLVLNYRWQAVGSGETRLAFAPRVSFLAPTGEEADGLGAGGWGVQVNLPVSVVLGPRIVSHWNLGTTRTRSAQNAAGDDADTRAYALGASLVWLARPKVNGMLEAAWASEEEVVGPGRTEREGEFFLNPGVRWAIDLPSGLQIVPGVAIPIGLGPSEGERAVFLYLSFEHPFAR